MRPDPVQLATMLIDETEVAYRAFQGIDPDGKIGHRDDAFRMFAVAYAMGFIREGLIMKLEAEQRRANKK